MTDPIEIKYKTEKDWLEAKSHDVTSTEVSALFGLSPYITEFELYHIKTGQLENSFQNNDRVKWGNRLEAAIAQGIAEDYGWQARPLKVYMRHGTVSRMGSSFDYEVDCPERGKGILEIKNVDWKVFQSNWQEDEAPEHIEIQLQHQLEVAGKYSWGAIGALIGGNQPHIIMRDRDEDMGRALCNSVAKFWQRVADENPPPPVFPIDADAIISMHRDVGNETVDARGDEALKAWFDRYSQIADEIKSLEDQKKECKAEILRSIGDAAVVIGDGYKLTANTVKGSTYTVTREDYRGFRLTKKKGL